MREARYHQDADTPEERYAGYEIHAHDGERLGKLDALFVDENDNPEYVGVTINPSTTTASLALVPAEVVMVEDASRRMVVTCPRRLVEAAPRLGEGQQLEAGLEERVRAHYGLTSPPEGAARYGASYDAYYRSEAQERGPSEAAPIASGAEDVGRLTAGEDPEEIRVRRSEEELRTRTREREAGALRVRKRVRTDRQRIEVPKKRVEVRVERVPVEEEEEGEAAAAGSEMIGGEEEEEIVVPIVEEEVVVEKRPVVKEEVRIRKEVVEDTEIVEEDVKREEIEVDDQSNTR